MRLGYSHTLLHREQVFGQKLDGIGVYTKSLYQEIHKKNNRVIPFDFCRIKELFKRGNQQSSPILSTLLPPLISLHKNLEEQIDVFHATDYLIPRLKNKPVVATLHDAIMFKNPEFASGLRKIKNLALKRSAQWADQVITVSQTMVNDIVNYWDIKPEKVTAIYNGIDPIWYQTLSPEAKASVLKKFSIDKPFILSVGTLQPRKNFSRLIQAFLNLPSSITDNFQLIIVGKEGWECEPIIRDLQRLEQHGKGKWLKYVGFEELRALYQSATVFAFPSLAEGFGFPVIEGFASNAPVLAANTTSIPEIAGDAAYLIDPEDLESITEGLKALINNEALCAELRQKGIIQSQLFSWERCAEETLRVLKQACR